MYDAILTFADNSGRYVLSDRSMSNLCLKVAKEVAEKEKVMQPYKHVAIGENLFMIREVE